MRPLACVLLALTFAAPAVAKDAPSFILGGGLTLPLADYGNVDGTGFDLGAGVSVPLGSGAFAAQLDGLFSRTGHDGVPGHTRIAGGMVGLVYRAPMKRSMKPYVRAAIGLLNVKTSQLIGIGFDTLPYSYSETKPSFGGGVGVMIGLGRTDLFVEGRVIVVNTADRSTTFVPLTIGIAFGRK